MLLSTFLLIQCDQMLQSKLDPIIQKSPKEVPQLILIIKVMMLLSWAQKFQILWPTFVRKNVAIKCQNSSNLVTMFFLVSIK